VSEQTVTAVIEKVTDKEGATNGRAWRKFGILADDVWYGTFDAALGQQAKDLEGQRAVIRWQQNSKKPDLNDFLGATAANGDHPVPAEAREAIAARTDSGEADWDLIGLRKTRCLLWAHFIDSPMAAAIAAGSGDKPPAFRVHDFGAQLVALAESDIYHRDPASADEAIPF